MKKLLLIASHEFIVTVTQASYLLSLIGIPLFILIIGGVLKYAFAKLEPLPTKVRAGIVDYAGVIDFRLAENVSLLEAAEPPEKRSQAERVRIRSYQSLANGLEDLQGARLDFLCVIDADFVKKGEMKLYTRSMWVGETPDGMNHIRALLRASIVQSLSGKHQSEAGEIDYKMRRILTPASMSRFSMTGDGTVMLVDSTWKLLSRSLITYGLVLLLAISVFMSANNLLQATAEEKENRVVEVMLSSVNPVQLLGGKILGLGGASLLQAATYIGLAGLAMFYYGEQLSLTAGDLVLSLIYCLIGFVLYAGIFAAIGILSGNLHNKSQFVMPLMLVVSLPVLMEFLLIDTPDGALAKIFSYFPLTAPLTMIYRLTLTKTPVIDIALSLGLLAGSAYLSVKGAARIFRVASLMYGKQITGPEILRWLREPSPSNPA